MVACGWMCVRKVECGARQQSREELIGLHAGPIHDLCVECVPHRSQLFEVHNSGVLTLSGLSIRNAMAVGSLTEGRRLTEADENVRGGVAAVSGGGHVAIEGCSLSNCKAVSGGAVYVVGEGSSACLSQCKFVGCKAINPLDIGGDDLGHGGAVTVLHGAALQIEACEIIDCYAVLCCTARAIRSPSVCEPLAKCQPLARHRRSNAEAF